MKLVTLLFILFSLTLNAIALDVILNPYKDLNYEEITTYYIDQEKPCSCDCYDFEENKKDQVYRHWWE